MWMTSRSPGPEAMSVMVCCRVEKLPYYVFPSRSTAFQAKHYGKCPVVAVSVRQWQVHWVSKTSNAWYLSDLTKHAALHSFRSNMVFGKTVTVGRESAHNILLLRFSKMGIFHHLWELGEEETSTSAWKAKFGMWPVIITSAIWLAHEDWFPTFYTLCMKCTPI